MSKTIIAITGANQGLGLEIAKRLSTKEKNLHLIIAGRSLPKVSAAVKSLEANKDASNTLSSLELDVTSDASIAAAVQQISTDHGRLDVLMNNAGIANPPDKTASLRSSYASVFDVNVFSVAALTDACIPLLQKSTNPRIVMQSSTMASVAETLNEKSDFYRVGPPFYKASKTALNLLTAWYASEYAKEGFKVNSNCPGYRKTNISSFSEYAGDPAEGAVNACRLIMLGKDGETGTFSDLNGPIKW